MVSVKTAFDHLLGQLEIMQGSEAGDEDRIYIPHHNAVGLNFAHDGGVGTVDDWQNAPYYDGPSTAYNTTSTNTIAPSTPMTTEYDHNNMFAQSNVRSRPSTAVVEDACNSPACDAPDCDNEFCEEAYVECTNPDCLPEEVQAHDHDADSSCGRGASLCAGSIEIDVAQAAAYLTAMRPAPQTQNSGNEHYFPPLSQDYSFCMSLANDLLSGMDQHQQTQHPPHYGPCLFTNAYVPVPQSNQGNMMGDGVCQYIPNNNYCQSHETYHSMGPGQPNFQNSTLQYAMSLRDLSSRASSSQDPFAFSNEATPSSGSTYSSPHRSLSNRTSGSQMRVRPTHSHSMSAGDRDRDNSPPVCQWQESPSHPVCGLVCPSKSALQSHIQSTHTAPLSKSLGFICRWAGCSRLNMSAPKASFAQRSKLDRHMQSHTGHKACKCKECGHEFSTSQTLESHMRTHSGDKPFKCLEPGCGYKAAQASQLTMHTRTKHTREKPLVCDYPDCGRRFAESSNLSKHRKIHEPEEECRCSVCGKGFRRKDQLRRHGKIHQRKEGGDTRSLAGSQGSGSGTMTPILPPLSVLSRRMTGGGRPEYEDSEMGDVSALSPSPSVASVGQGQGFRRLEGGFEDEERERERDLPLGVRIDPRIGVFNAADAQVEGRMPSVGSFAPAPGLGLGLVGSEMDRLAVAAAQRGSVTPNELERLD